MLFGIINLPDGAVAFDGVDDGVGVGVGCR